MNVVLLLGSGLLTAILAYFGVHILKAWIKQKGILDIPNARSSHAAPTPRGGGIVIVFLTLCGWLMISLLLPRYSYPWSVILPFTIGGAFISGISWLDDINRLSENSQESRLLVHALGAVLATLSFGYIEAATFPLIGSIQLSWLGYPVTALWIVGLINIYNFMDGIDGIAASQAIVVSLGWVILGAVHGLPLVVLLALLLAASTSGFLLHNWPPARIFMGDVGSTFLGYMLAVLPVAAAKEDSALLLSGVLLLWPFLFDTIFTILRRLARGENILLPHRSHLYQRLVIVGYSHRTVTLLYIGLALSGLFLALLLENRFAGWKQHLIILPFIAAALWLFVRKQERELAAGNLSNHQTG